MTRLIDSEDQLARNVAETLRLVGAYTKTLNNAAQLYAEADKKSFISDDAFQPMGPDVPSPTTYGSSRGQQQPS